MAIMNFNPDLNRLADALGVPANAASWSLICNHEEAVQVECTFYPEAAYQNEARRDSEWTIDAPLGDALVKRYHLVAIQEDKSDE